jgi:protein involved in polysaccharide export with SLBB domain
MMPSGKTSKKAVLFLLLLISLGSCLAGCTTMEPARTTADMAKEPVPQLLLAPGDVIDVKFFYVPELDESQIVRPDGFMTLQLVGDVQAQGQTPATLHRELLKRYGAHLKNPNITIMVRRVNDSRVWVGGEVKRPGPVQMPGRLTVLEAIMDVGGGARPMADLKNVLVVRQREGKSYGCLVNIKEVLRGKESDVFLLQPRDVVYVPPTAITQVDDWIDQYINKLVPQAKGLFLYPVGPGGGGTLGIDTTTGR